MKNKETKKPSRSVIGRSVLFRKHSACCSPRRSLAAGGRSLGLLPSAFLPAFTLVELMITVGLFGLVMAGSLGVYVMCQKMWHATSLGMETSQMANLAIQRMVIGLGTNGGLRAAAASSVVIQTNAYGHPYPFSATNKYWESGNPPPAAADPVHYMHVGCAYISSYGSDGSWRLLISNATDGVTCFDYNKKMRNILFCPDIAQTTAARQKRISVCNYVASASATNTAAGVGITLTVWKQDGMFVASNEVSAFIRMRN